jgi:hypothetical protein
MVARASKKRSHRMLVYRDTQEVIGQGWKLMMRRGMTVIRNNMLIQATPDMLSVVEHYIGHVFRVSGGAHRLP